MCAARPMQAPPVPMQAPRAVFIRGQSNEAVQQVSPATFSFSPLAPLGEAIGRSVSTGTPLLYTEVLQCKRKVRTLKQVPLRDPLTTLPFSGMDRIFVRELIRGVP